MKIEELRKFLIIAKKSTYAAGDKNKVESTVPASTDLKFEQADFTYRDRYFGSDLSGGEEVVWFRGKPVWMMNYYNFVVEKVMDSHELFDFLKKCLGKTEEKLPLRGPEEFEENNLKYTFEVEGELERFTGVEKIFLKEKLIYVTYVHGGLLSE